MAYQPVADVAHVQLMGRMDGQVCINDWYFEISGGGITAIGLAALAVAVQEKWNGIVAQLSEDFAQTRVVCTDLTTATGPRVERNATDIGGVASESAPNKVAACGSVRTDQRGRSARGRNYLAGVPNANIDLNTLDAAWMDNILLLFEDMIGPGALLAGWQWVIVSRQTAGALRPAGLAIPVTGVVFTTNTVRSMRSREVGHGA